MPIKTSSYADGRATSKSRALLDIDEHGAVEGVWYCNSLGKDDINKIGPYGNDLAAVVKIQIALRTYQNCLLLRATMDRREPLALLVVPISVVKSGPVLKCRYIGAVVWSHDKKDHRGHPHRPERRIIRLGGSDEGTKSWRGRDALQEMEKYMDASFESDDGISVKASGEESREQSDDDDSIMTGKDETQITSSVGDKPLVRSQIRKWLEQAGVQTYSPLHLVQSKTHSDHLQRQEGDEHLIRALRSKNKNVVRYLVKNGIAREAKSILESPQYGGVTLIGAKMFGDICVENTQLKNGIKMYKHVIKSYEMGTNTDRSNHLDPKERLRLLHTQFSLGTAYVKGAKYEKASGIFSNILAKCKERTKRKDMKRVKDRIPTTTDYNSMMADQVVGNRLPDAHKQDSPTTTSDNQAKAKRKWYWLKLSAIAELTLLYISRFDFENAATTYGKSLRIFSELPEDIEAFAVLWETRRKKPFQTKSKRDERASEVYRRALRRFDTMFRKNHTLILMTALNLGVNYMNRFKFSESEPYLIRALEGFHRSSDEHPIIALTRYNIGLLFTSQQKLVEANAQLSHATFIASLNGFNAPDSIMFRLSADCALGRNYMDGQGPDYAKAEGIFSDVLRDSEPYDLRRIIFEATLGGLQMSFRQNKLNEATMPAEQILSILKTKATLGPDQPDVDACEAMLFLAATDERQNRLPDAEKRLEETLAQLLYLEGNRSPLRVWAFIMTERSEFSGGSGSYIYHRGSLTKLRKYAAGHTKAQTLGAIHLEKGALAKAEDMYSKAFDILYKRSHKKMVEMKLPKVTDLDTFLAAMDLGNARFMIPSRESKLEAVQSYQFAVEGRTETLLQSVLCAYDTEPKLAPGHRKRIRIMDNLIEYYNKTGKGADLRAMEEQKWRELKDAYGVDQASMIMDITHLKHVNYEHHDDTTGDCPDGHSVDGRKGDNLNHEDVNMGGCDDETKKPDDEPVPETKVNPVDQTQEKPVGEELDDVNDFKEAQHQAAGTQITPQQELPVQPNHGEQLQNKQQREAQDTGEQHQQIQAHRAQPTGTPRVDYDVKHQTQYQSTPQGTPQPQHQSAPQSQHQRTPQPRYQDTLPHLIKALHRLGIQPSLKLTKARLNPSTKASPSLSTKALLKPNNRVRLSPSIKPPYKLTKAPHKPVTKMFHPNNYQNTPQTHQNAHQAQYHTTPQPQYQSTPQVQYQNAPQTPN
ncbi:hypothetical protein PT974_07549 [Cladobotryum mycophilum]|uniref:Uncharacterized protein n=1 Tax=Cladobotryum mycophilum TaxID=491253 RepID=A0ABR0SPT6_9HYPO